MAITRPVPARAPERSPGERRAARARSRARAGVESNARLTGSTAAVLLVLLAVEGVSLLRIVPLLGLHVFIGMMLVPPVALKIGSTMWRFGRYYLGSPAYQEKGPPAPLLRLIGPLVVVLTVAVLASGIALLLVSGRWRSDLLLLHKASFVLWFCVMALHVLGHLIDTARLAPLDLYMRTRRQVAGAGLRQWTLAAALAVGFMLGALLLPHAAHFFSPVG